MEKKVTTQSAILEAITAFPKSTVKDLVAFLNSDYNIVKSGVRRLEIKGQIIRNVETANQRFHIFYSINPEYVEGVVLNKILKPKTYENQRALQIEVEELREWKRRALIAFPELNVDPLIYKAREIYAKHTDDKKLKDEIYSGRLDKRPPMLALIEVLENGS